MKNRITQGILVVGHGSRREEANADVRQAARLIGERGRFPLVEAAFLEIEQPDISEGFSRLVERGAESILIHPYFLSPGRHTRGDIPVKVAETAADHPGIDYLITEPLAAHDLVIAASIERIRETSELNSDEFSFLDQEPDFAGTAFIVGAGPGDVGLLTVRGKDVLQSSDVVIYDHLVNREILDLVPSEAETIYVGKIGGSLQIPQDEINRLLVHHALKGKQVVRLKGGDPFLFGRGGEEALVLREAGIKFEIVPGVSSALAVPAYAGIPLTHRGLSSSVTVLTGTNAKKGKIDLNAPHSRTTDFDTLVILMGVTRLSEIVEDLVASGRDPETPAAVIRWGTYRDQVVVVGELKSIAKKVEQANLRSPAVIVVGEVVNLRHQLDWFETETVQIGAKNLEAVTAHF